MILDEENGYDVEGDVKPEENPLEGLTDAEQNLKAIFGDIKTAYPELLTEEEKARLVERYGPTRVKNWLSTNVWPSYYPGLPALRAMANASEFSIEMRDLYERRWAQHEERQARRYGKRPFQKVIDRFGGERQSPVHMRPIGPREWIRAQVMVVKMEEKQEGPYITTGFDSDEVKSIETLTDAVMARFSNGELNGIENITERKIVERVQALGFGSKMPWLSVQNNLGIVDNIKTPRDHGMFIPIAKGKCFPPPLVSPRQFI